MPQVIIPFRPVDEARVANAQRAGAFWRDGFGFEVGFYDSGELWFNRAASLNLGVRESTGDVLILADVDVTGDPRAIRQALEACQDGNVHLPYDQLYMLDEHGESGTIVHGNISCIQVLTREAYEAAGGNDERFSGWGFEDNAFGARIEAAGRRFVRHQGLAVHHWHPVYWRAGDAAYEANRRLWEDEYLRK